MLEIQKKYQLFKKLPGPGLLNLLGPTKDFINDPLECIGRYNKEFGDLVVFPLGKECTLLVTDPDFISHIFANEDMLLVKSSAYKLLERLLGKGIITATGQQWRTERAVAAPFFHPKHIAKAGEIIAEETNRMVDSWFQEGNAKVIDFSDEMSKLTVGVIMKVLFSADLDEKQRISIRESLQVMQEYMHHLFYSVLVLPKFVPTPRNIKAKEAVSCFDAICAEIIRERRKDRNPPDDLLTAYLAYRSPEKHRSLQDSTILDDIKAFMLAGHETTASALCAGFHVLARNPTIVDQIVDEYTELSAKLPFDKVQKKAKLPKQFFQEVLRLYPSTWSFGRETKAEFEYKGVTIPKGVHLIISQWGIHRNPKYWDKPEVFDIERFSPENAKNQTPYSYIPFGAGKRICIGQSFSQFEAQIIIPIVMQRCRLWTTDNKELEVKARITLVASEPVKLRVEKREEPKLKKAS